MFKIFIFLSFFIIFYTQNCGVKQTNCYCNLLSMGTFYISPPIYCFPLNGIYPICSNNKILTSTCFCDNLLCSSNQLCNSTHCLNSCKKDNIVTENTCICGANQNVCNVGQICKDGDCLSLCPNHDIAPEIGCICGANNNVCIFGQICKDGDCYYPPPSRFSVLFLIIGLFFAFTLILVCFCY